VNQKKSSGLAPASDQMIWKTKNKIDFQRQLLEARLEGARSVTTAPVTLISLRRLAPAEHNICSG
jgi:hypothetical protein